MNKETTMHSDSALDVKKRTLPSILATLTTALLAIGVIASTSYTLVQRNREIRKMQELTPAGFKVILSTNNLSEPAYAVTAGAIWLLLTSLLTLVLLALIHRHSRTSSGRSTHKPILLLTLIPGTLATLLTLAAAIPVTLVAARRRIHVYVSLAGAEVDAGLFDARAAALGFSLRYWDRRYVCAMAILPWPLIISALIMLALLFSRYKAEKAHHMSVTQYQDRDQVRDADTDIDIEQRGSSFPGATSGVGHEGEK